MVQEEGAGGQAEQAVQPLRAFAQQLQSTQAATEAARNYTPKRDNNPRGNMAKGYSTRSGNSVEDFDAQPEGDEGSRNVSQPDREQGSAKAEGDNPQVTSWQGTDDDGNAITHNTVSGSYTTGETGVCLLCAPVPAHTDEQIYSSGKAVAAVARLQIAVLRLAEASTVTD